MLSICQKITYRSILLLVDILLIKISRPNVVLKLCFKQPTWKSLLGVFQKEKSTGEYGASWDIIVLMHGGLICIGFCLSVRNNYQKLIH